MFHIFRIQRNKPKNIEINILLPYTQRVNVIEDRLLGENSFVGSLFYHIMLTDRHIESQTNALGNLQVSLLQVLYGMDNWGSSRNEKRRREKARTQNVMTLPLSWTAVRASRWKPRSMFTKYVSRDAMSAAETGWWLINGVARQHAGWGHAAYRWDDGESTARRVHSRAAADITRQPTSQVRWHCRTSSLPLYL